MANTLNSRYLKSSIGDTKAVLEVGWGQDRTEWIIEPAHDAPGYIVNKTQYFKREKDIDLFSFSTEPETIEYLVKEIVENIVYCRYWDGEKETALKSGSLG